MRTVIAFVTAVICLICVAQAQTKFKLKDKFSETDVAGACADVDGEFFPSSAGGGSYSCIKQNCDGKGGYCGVECNNKGECEGTTPSLEAGPRSNPLQILRPQLSRSPGEQAGADMSNNTDLPGSNYERIRVRSAKECQAACKRTGRCKAWTYVRPGFQGLAPVCHLKDGLPAPTRNNCCISGKVRDVEARVCCRIRGAHYRWSVASYCRRGYGTPAPDRYCLAARAP
jgi:hypothetical protein